MKYVLIDLIYESYKNCTTMCMQPVLNVYKQKTPLMGGKTQCLYHGYNKNIKINIIDIVAAAISANLFSLSDNLFIISSGACLSCLYISFSDGTSKG